MDLSVGDEVFGEFGDGARGGLAEYVCAPSKWVVKKTD